MHVTYGGPQTIAAPFLREFLRRAKVRFGLNRNVRSEDRRTNVI